MKGRVRFVLTDSTKHPCDIISIDDVLINPIEIINTFIFDTIL